MNPENPAPPTDLKHRVAMELLGWTFQPQHDVVAGRYCKAPWALANWRGYLIPPENSGLLGATCIACEGDEFTFDDMLAVIEKLELRFVLGRALHTVNEGELKLGYNAHVWNGKVPISGLSDDPERGLSLTPQEALARAMLDWKKKIDRQAGARV